MMWMHALARLDHDGIANRGGGSGTGHCVLDTALAKQVRWHAQRLLAVLDAAAVKLIVR